MAKTFHLRYSEKFEKETELKRSKRSIVFT
jgi:hypothetical protein